MENTTILGQEARRMMKQGVDLVANAVKVTLGAKGMNVICVRDMLMPVVTKDGVSVAKEVSGNDPIVNAGASMIKQVADETNEKAGDGCQDLNSRILTPSGFRRFGDLKVGDEICGTNGTFQTVEGIFPKGVKELYKFTFTDKRTTEACDNHMWSVITSYGSKKNLTTKQLIDSGKVLKLTKNGDKEHGYYIPNTFVDFKQTSKLPLDPYLLGALLGDGSLSGTGSVELSLGKNKEHILDKLILPENTTYTKNWVDRKNYFRVKFKMIDMEVGGLSIVAPLKELGLFGTTSHTKFIPDSYLYGNLDTRNKLIQGLLDTDGYKNDRGLYSFSSVNRELANQVLELFRGLGKTATIRTIVKKGTDSYANNPIYEVAERKGYKYGIQLNSIEPTGKFVEVQCIKVSNEDSLYITDDYIVTHNTTSSTVLAQAIVEESFQLLEDGANAISVQRGLLKGLSFCVKEIQKLANKKTDKKTITSVAHISSNGDKEITKLVVDAIVKVGKNGTIKVEQTDKTESFVSVSEGYEIESPFVDAKFITNDKKYTSELENVNVVIFDGRIQDAKELYTAIELCLPENLEEKEKAPLHLLVIASSVSPSVQLGIAEYHRLGHSFMNINAPSFGLRRAETLKDIATVIGAKYLNQDLGDSLEKIEKKDLGFVAKVVADANKTVLVDGKGSAEAIKERISTVTEQVKTVIGGKKEVVFIKDRLSKLKKGVAVINVGGFSKPERREKEDRIEDALCAIRATLEQGFVAGEGVTYIRVAQALKSAQIEVKNKDEQKGIEVLIKALYAPFKQILVNAGLNPNDHLKEIEEGVYGMGVDLDEDTIINLFEQNIIDPTKVSIMALQNATSISSTFLSTGAITYNEASPFAMDVQ